MSLSLLRMCPGCGNLLGTIHLMCICPVCHGPKSPRAQRCSACGGRGRPRGVRQSPDQGARPRPEDEQLDPIRTEAWALTCLSCAREEFVDVPVGIRIAFDPRCGFCGGRRFAEPYMDGLQLIGSPVVVEVLRERRDGRAAA